MQFNCQSIVRSIENREKEAVTDLRHMFTDAMTLGPSSLHQGVVVFPLREFSTTTIEEKNKHDSSDS